MPSDPVRPLSLAPVPPDDDQARLADEALDTVAVVFRALAQTARADGAAATLEAWARHLLVLAPPPGLEDAPAGVRQWSHARTAASVHIRREATTVGQNLSDLQDVVWAVVESTARIVEEDARLDRRAASCIERLRSAVGRPPDQLRRAALDAVAELGDVLEARAGRDEPVDGELAHRIASLTAQLDAARREADVDAVTGLASRRVFDREVDRATHLQKLSGEPLCLLLVDLDRFKDVNDRYGHATGDAALKLVARELTRAFPRSSDLIARYGGDELAVLLRYVTSGDGERLAGRFLEELRGRRLHAGEDELRVLASVGVAEVGTHDTPRSVVDRADRALYDAKASGRDRVVVAPPCDPSLEPAATADEPAT